ncbi:MAG TPA: hypothetical protein VHE30_09465 [Polyangiaceae bacterium]|nr:hypothetical protein [Polyangiaceae bacterium]
MALLNLPEPYGAIDALVEQGDYSQARATLTRTQGTPALAELIEVKIALLDGSLQPQIAMNRLLAVMRKEPKLPGLQELYKEASRLSYDEGASSLSHSHPPPPMKPRT